MIAKRIACVGLALFGLLGSAGCRIRIEMPFFDDQAVQGSGKIVDQSRSVAGFDALEIYSAIEARFEPSDQMSVVITCDDNLLPFVTTTVTDNRLVIALKPNTSMRTTEPIRALIKGSSMKSVAVNDASSFEASALKGESLALAAHGAGRMTVGAIDADQVEVEAVGASKLKLAGRAGAAKFTISGAAQVDSAELTSENLAIEASGASVAKVNSSSITGDASGASKIVVRGEPSKRIIKTSGASSISFE